MKIANKINYIVLLALAVPYIGCKAPSIAKTPDIIQTPASYLGGKDTVNSVDINWRNFFNDESLVKLIDTAINNNIDLLMTLQDIDISKNNLKLKSGLLYPTVSARAGLGLEKVGLYTASGAGDAITDITPGQLVPENLTDLTLGIQASWEADIWGKLRTSKKAAYSKYLSTVEGKNFVQTNLVAEVANNYYELQSFDYELEIIRQTIDLQKNQLEIVKIQKEASVVNELAVKQFEAQLYNAQSLEYEMVQKITETENKINFLLGRFPQKIIRNKTSLSAQIPSQIKTGIPSQLLKNRPDIKQAELELVASKLEVKAAKFAFYPSLNISSTLGVNAFKPTYLFTMPQSLAYSLIGDLAGPIINRTAIIAEYKNANAYQIQAMYNYQKTILNGFVEISNELANINNLQKAYDLKSKETDALNSSVEISTDLFKSAKANYLEVLMTQKEALASKLELAEAKKKQFVSVTNIYKSLGGGWK